MTTRSGQQHRPSELLEVTFRLECDVCEDQFVAQLGGDLLEDAERGGLVYTECPRCDHQRKCRVVVPDPPQSIGVDSP